MSLHIEKDGKTQWEHIQEEWAEGKYLPYE